MLKIFQKKPLDSTRGKKKPEEKKKEEKKEPLATQAKIVKKEVHQAYRYLSRPLITEKSSALLKQNKYVFKVMLEANKAEVKKAVQNMYGVKVTDINVINIPRKRRRFGRNEGYKPGYKKAIITLAPGEKIEEL